MKQYKLIEGSASDVSEKVTAAINNGWDLHGDPYHANNTHYQAVTRGCQPEFSTGFSNVYGIPPTPSATPAEAIKKQDKKDK